MAAVKTLEDALQWAEELGLRGTLQDLEPAGAWTGAQSHREEEDLERLEADARHRAMHAHAPGYESRLATMMHWVALYKLAFPNHVLFLPLHMPDTHVVHACHNESTLAKIRLFMDRHGSLQRGREGQKTASDGKAAVTSTLRAFRSVEARYDVCDPRFNQLLSHVGQQMRREDAPRSERGVSQGIRAMHLVQLRERGVQVSTFDFALGHTALQVAARGGEPGLRDRQQQSDFQPARGCVWSDFHWRTEAQSQSHSVPIARPVLVPGERRTGDAPQGADPNQPPSLGTARRPPGVPIRCDTRALGRSQPSCAGVPAGVPARRLCAVANTVLPHGRGRHRRHLVHGRPRSTVGASPGS